MQRIPEKTGAFFSFYGIRLQLPIVAFPTVGVFGNSLLRFGFFPGGLNTAKAFSPKPLVGRSDFIVLRKQSNHLKQILHGVVVALSTSPM